MPDQFGRMPGCAAVIAGLALGVSPAAGQETVQYGYDALGRVVAVTYGNGTTITYTYDMAGNRLEVTTGAGGGGNANPIAINDYAETRVAQTSSIMVLANDSDPDGHTLFVSAVTTPTAGTATISSGGGYVSYTAPAAPGTYTFGYTANDGQGGTATASVEVFVRKSAGYCDRYPDDPYC